MKALVRFFMRRFEWIFAGPLAAFYWFLLLVLAISTVVCGTLAWLSYDLSGDDNWVVREDSPTQLLWLDALHRGAKALFSSDLFVAGKIDQTPILVIATRFLGAGFFVLMAGRLFLFAAGGRMSRAFARARKGHEIVIGDSDTAYRYMKASGNRINHLHIGQASLLGDGLERVVNMQRSRRFEKDLRRAGLHRCKRLIVAEQSDQQTWATARGIVAYLDPEEDKEIIANIEEPWLLERVSKADPEAMIRPFSYASGAARQIMLAHPPFLLARAYDAPSQHIVIVGFGPMGQALLREFLVTSVSHEPEDMMVTVIDEDADTKGAQFRARHPGLSPYVTVEFLKGDLTVEDETLETRFSELVAKDPVCAVYIATEEEENPLRMAVGVKDRSERLGWCRCPIFVLAPEGAGLPMKKQGIGKIGIKIDDGLQPTHQLYDLCLAPYGGWKAALDGAGLLSPEFDDQARAFHNAYRNLVGANSKPVAALPPSQRPWPVLAEEYRVSNRRAAAHIRTKLDAAGYDLAPWLEGGATLGRPHMTHDLPPAAHVLELDDAMEIERLASLEHRRWCIDRALNSWRYGVKRDDTKRRHPLMVRNRNLSEDEKEKDRSNIRETAELIKRITTGDYERSRK